MTKRVWLILGATSLIAKEFAHLVAREGHSVLLVGRHHQQLELMAADISLRYHVHCEAITADFSVGPQQLIKIMEHQKNTDLFIAHSLMMNNNKLTTNTIGELITVNITSTIQLIEAYWHKKQKEHHLIFISSVAACRGRAKNSLYGASKAAVETYLQGLQQAASHHQQLTIARLGYIDTHVTYGEPGIFYASPPKSCANACWSGLKKQKRLIYHPFFWRYIMAVISYLPFSLYKKMRGF
jgi:short-subunit dehydrogenase